MLPPGYRAFAARLMTCAGRWQGASPNLNFVLGFKRGINRCLETAVSNPVTLCQIGGSVPAATFKNAAALAGIVATGRVFALGAVMHDLQNDINGSPNPYQAGIRYGRRFCIWMGPPSPLRGRRRRARTRWQQPLGAVLHRFGSTAASTRRSAAPREGQPMAASVHPGELQRQLWLCRPGGGPCAWRSQHRSAATSPFTTIYRDLRDFTRASARSKVNKSTG
jgi:hypothetical protein